MRCIQLLFYPCVTTHTHEAVACCAFTCTLTHNQDMYQMLKNSFMYYFPPTHCVCVVCASQKRYSADRAPMWPTQTHDQMTSNNLCQRSEPCSRGKVILATESVLQRIGGGFGRHRGDAGAPQALPAGDPTRVCLSFPANPLRVSFLLFSTCLCWEREKDRWIGRWKDGWMDE